MAVTQVSTDRLDGLGINALCLMQVTHVEVGAHEYRVEAHATRMQRQEVVECLLRVPDGDRPLMLIQCQLSDFSQRHHVGLARKLLGHFLLHQCRSQSQLVLLIKCVLVEAVRDGMCRRLPHPVASTARLHTQHNRVVLAIAKGRLDSRKVLEDGCESLLCLFLLLLEFRVSLDLLG